MGVIPEKRKLSNWLHEVEFPTSQSTGEESPAGGRLRLELKRGEEERQLERSGGARVSQRPAAVGVSPWVAE